MPNQHEVKSKIATPAELRRVAKAIRFVAREKDSSLEEAAGVAGLSPFHFQRLFRRLTGVSPKRFSQSLTFDRAESLLRADSPTLRAAHEAGLSSGGRLHDLSIQVRGMTPGELRNGGADLRLRYGVHPSVYGECLVVVSERGLVEFAFVDDVEVERELQERWPRATLTLDAAATAPMVQQVDEASKGQGPLTLHLRGSGFQIRVWKALLNIPSGQVTSYGELAKVMGEPGAARALGNALASNALALAIPCHRVLLAHGALGQYRWGPERKRAILAFEKSRSSL